MTTPSGAPAAARERLDSLDFVRGIAVLGILFANIMSLGQPTAAGSWPGGFVGGDGPHGGWLWAAQFVLIDGKMRGLFTLLFGAGMVLFMERARARGASRWLLVRRLAVLFVFGALHDLLLWRGDILSTYALAGLLLVPLLGLRRRQLLVLGALTYFYAVAAGLAGTAPLPGIAEGPASDPVMRADQRSLAEAKQAELDDDRAEAALIQAGAYGRWAAHNVTEHGADLIAQITYLWTETLPLMMLGMALYRYGLFSGGLDPGRQRAWGWAALAAGTLASCAIALWALRGGLTYWGTYAAFEGWGPLPRLLMTLGLAALLAPLGARAGGWLAQRLKACGQTAFTNYLGTSLVALFVFHGFGLGLFARLDRLQLYGLAVAGCALMLLWARPWLARFRQGPLEWLWRCLTYGRMLPFRR